MPCLEIWSPVCQAATPCYLLEQKDIIPLVPQHTENWETEAHDHKNSTKQHCAAHTAAEELGQVGTMDGGQRVFDDSQVLPRALGWCWERNDLSSAQRRWGCPELASQPVPQFPPEMFGLLQRFAVCWEIIKETCLTGNAI